jgi:cell division septal protein FtsQ
MISFTKRKKNNLSAVKTFSTERFSVLQRQMLIGTLVMASIGIFITAVWYVTRISSFQLVTNEVVGGVTIPHETITEKIDSVLQGSYLRIIPKRFIPLYPHDEIVQRLKEIPRIKNVYVEHVGDQKLAIVYDEYVPFALWCEQKKSTDCLFIDGQGFAFAKAPTLDGSAFIRYVDEEKKPELQKNIFELSFLKQSMLFTELLTKNLELYVTHIERKGQYDIEYTVAGGGVIKVSQKSDAEKTFNNLKTILASKEFEHITPGDFEYIDLRFGDKVFVREVQSQATSTPDTPSNP